MGRNGGGWAHYVGQEKRRPATGWAAMAMGTDWSRPPRQMAGTAYWYAHTDQWRYDGYRADALPSPVGRGRFRESTPWTADFGGGHGVDAVYRVDRSSLEWSTRPAAGVPHGGHWQWRTQTRHRSGQPANGLGYSLAGGQLAGLVRCATVLPAPPVGHDVNVANPPAGGRQHRGKLTACR